MSLVKKLKDILFEVEEEDTEEIKVVEEPVVAEEPVKTEEVVLDEPKKEVPSERELFKSENNFKFPDFDEDEFQSSFSRVKPVNNGNVLEYERKKTYEKRTDYGRYERVETREVTEKKKFKPSPIISPVYGVLNQDYKAEDIVDKNSSASNIDIDSVRKKAFQIKDEEVETLNETKIDEPVVTFFEEKETFKIKSDKEEFKTLNELLESAAEEISLEDTLEIPKTNNLDAIEEELEKLEIEKPVEKDNLEDTLDNDLFELIDSMYDEREED